MQEKVCKDNSNIVLFYPFFMYLWFSSRYTNNNI